MAADITARIEEWRTHLLATSKRNPLINFRTGRTGGITLLHPAVGPLWDRLVVQGGRLTFAWKRDLIDLPDEPEEDSPELPAGPMVVATGRPHTNPIPDILGQCLRSPKLRGDQLLTDLTDTRLASRLTRLALNAREAQSD